MKHFCKLFVYILIISFTTLLNPVELTNSCYSTNINPDTTELKTDENNDSTVLEGTSANVVYYNQKDPKWADKIYGGNNTISVYGCGPTTLAMLVSSLTEETLTPDQMAKWAYDNGYFCENSGSYHSIIPEGAAKWGLNVQSVTDYSFDNITSLMSTGNLIVVLMGNGHFTENGHFLILRGVTLDGKLLIADPASWENTQKQWDTEIIINEAKYGCGNGGPMWSVSIY